MKPNTRKKTRPLSNSNLASNLRDFFNQAAEELLPDFLADCELTILDEKGITFVLDDHFSENYRLMTFKLRDLISEHLDLAKFYTEDQSPDPTGYIEELGRMTKDLDKQSARLKAMAIKLKKDHGT